MAKEKTQDEPEISPEMLKAGVAAYLGRATHDELSFATPEEIVRDVIRAALAANRDSQ